MLKKSIFALLMASGVAAAVAGPQIADMLSNNIAGTVLYDANGKVYYYSQQNVAFGTEKRNVTVTITATEGTLKIDATIPEWTSLVGAVPKIAYNGIFADATKIDDNSFSHTFEGEFTDGEALAIHVEVAGASFGQVNFVYNYGAENEPPAPAKPTPVIEASAQNVTETSAEIVYTVNLPEELQGATLSVTDNGTPVSGSPISITGLTPSTPYEHTLIATATKDGEDYVSAEMKVNFTTLREAGAADPVYYTDATLGETVCPIILTAENGGKLNVKAKVPGWESITGRVVIVKVWKTDGGFDQLKDTPNAPGDDGYFSFDFDGNFADNDQLRVLFQVNGQPGLGLSEFDYTYGSESEAPKENPELKAEVANVTKDGAEIIWNVILPPSLKDAVINVKINDADVTESPYSITGLTPDTKYDYNVAGTVTNGEQVYTLTPVEISFTTLSDESVIGNVTKGDTHVLLTVNEKEPEFAAFNYTIIPAADGKLTVTYTSEDENAYNFTGAVAKVQVKDGQAADVVYSDGQAVLTLDGPFSTGQEIDLNGWISYAGGDANIFNTTYKYGEETVIPEGNIFLFKVSNITTDDNVIVYYDSYLSESLKDADITVDWTATAVENNDIDLAPLAEPIAGSANTNPFEIEDVLSNTTYNFTFNASAKVGDLVVNAPRAFTKTITTGKLLSIDAINLENGDAKYFDLLGRPVVGNPDNGIYIKVLNGKSSKVMIRK